jgi:hypothetical protein
LELAAIAFADIRALFDRRGRPLPLDEVPPALRAAVKTFEARRVRRQATRGGDRVTETVEVVRVELWSKLATLDALARHRGMSGKRSEVNTVPAPPTTAQASDVRRPIVGLSRPVSWCGQKAA